MRVLAPAKLNLHLRVAPPDRSGHHPLMSWMCTIGLFDTLTIEPAGTTDVSLTCDDPSLPCDQTNLVVRAVYGLREALGLPHAGAERTRVAPDTSIRSAIQGVKVHLQKRIPMGGGLGGGSSDAARTLLALNRLWGLDWSLDRLSHIGATLGSDVPFFLHGPSSICAGRGEIVRAIAPPRPRWAVLVLPEYSLATPAVYRKFDDLRLGSEQAVKADPPVDRWTRMNARELLSVLVNDLEPAAFAICPRLRELREQVEQAIGRCVRMTGSGSTLFSLFDDASEAKQAVARIEESVKNKAAAAEIAPALADDLDVV